MEKPAMISIPEAFNKRLTMYSVILNSYDSCFNVHKMDVTTRSVSKMNEDGTSIGNSRFFQINDNYRFFCKAYGYILDDNGYDGEVEDWEYEIPLASSLEEIIKIAKRQQDDDYDEYVHDLFCLQA